MDLRVFTQCAPGQCMGVTRPKPSYGTKQLQGKSFGSC